MCRAYVEVEEDINAKNSYYSVFSINTIQTLHKQCKFIKLNAIYYSLQIAWEYTQYTNDFSKKKKSSRVYGVYWIYLVETSLILTYMYTPWK